MPCPDESLAGSRWTNWQRPLRKAASRQDHKRREVFVERTQTVADPGTHGRVSTEAVAGVEVVAGGGVIDRFSLGPPVKTNIIGTLFQVGPCGIHGCPGLAGLQELKGLLT